MKPRGINNFLSNDDTLPFRAGSVILFSRNAARNTRGKRRPECPDTGILRPSLKREREKCKKSVNISCQVVDKN
jgi:hypothetical protein